MEAGAEQAVDRPQASVRMKMPSRQIVSHPRIQHANEFKSRLNASFMLDGVVDVELARTFLETYLSAVMRRREDVVAWLRLLSGRADCGTLSLNTFGDVACHGDRTKHFALVAFDDGKGHLGVEFTSAFM